jgi:hypothetical protein
MAMKESSSENSRTPVAKKPYVKPSFRYEQVFVTSALSCGKIGGGIGSACHQNRKVS